MTIRVFLIPARYEATTQFMPLDNQCGMGTALLSAVAGRSGGLSSVAGDLLGVKNSGALFVGVLQSRTVRDRLISEFNLNQGYRASKIEDARLTLADRTSIYEDSKSGILSITVTDREHNTPAPFTHLCVTRLA